MVPWINSAADARAAVAAMRYPPKGGVRGAARMIRATGYGAHFDDYFEHSHERLLFLPQIESQAGLDNVDEIAVRVDGTA